MFVLKEYIGTLKCTVNFLVVFALLACWGFWACYSYNIRLSNDAENKNRTVSIYPIIVWWYKTPRWVLNKPKELYCPDGSACSVVRSDQYYRTWIDAKAYLFDGYYSYYWPLRRRPGELWAVLQYESPKCNPVLTYEQKLHWFNYSATFSVNSDVPFPLFLLHDMKHLTSEEQYIKTDIKNSHSNKISPIFCMHSDCDDMVGREQFVQELMKFIPVDHYGRCLKNMYMPAETFGVFDGPEVVKVIAKYKFVVAIENAVCEDYTTEKLWRALHAGAVPIYFGSSSVRDWLPNAKAAVLIQDHPTPRLLSEHLYQLIANDTLYEEYLTHKTKQVVRNERIRYEFTIRPYQNDPDEVVNALQCYVCRKIYESQRNPSPVTSRVITASHYKCPLSELSGRRQKHVYTRRYSKRLCAPLRLA